MIYTLSDIQDPLQSSAAANINISETSNEFIQLVNESQRRLLRLGKWWNTYGKYRICTTENCLVWPREIATIEAVAVCNQPVTIRNQWFEFLEAGWGLQGENCDSSNGGGSPWCCSGGSLLDRGTVPVFGDIEGDNKKIRVYADVTEDDDSEILIQGYDENNNWIRTQVDDEWVDGEYISISTTPTLSAKIFTSVTGVQKPLTNGPVRLYAYDTDELTQTALAYYESDETRPAYRKSFIPGLPDECGECDTGSVTVMARREFIPVRIPTDWLIIGNLEALSDEIMSIFKLRANQFQEAVAYEASAVRQLQQDLRRYVGNGVVQPLRMQPRNIGGAGVANLI